MAKTVYLANLNLDANLATAYLALESAGGVEISGHAYARQPVTFAAAAGGVKTSSADVTFPVATSDYGADVTTASLWDAVSGGNRLYTSEAFTGVEILLGDRLVVPSGNLTVDEISP